LTVKRASFPTVGACSGYGSCLVRNGNATGLGHVLSSSQLQIDDSGDIFIEYYANSTSQITDCMGDRISTTIRFRCPDRQLVSFACLETM